MKHTIVVIPEGRQRLTKLIAGTGDVIQVNDVVRIFKLDKTAAAKTLARWTSQGWLRRVKRGLYVPATLDSLGSEHVLDDPWVLVPCLFAPAYVGGRTAAAYWDLTEQIFNDIVVFTAQSVRHKSHRRHGATFTIKHINERKMFGCRVVWRGRTKVMVSDLQRTVVDILDDPSIGGGIRHVADCLAEYFKTKERNDTLLIDYSEKLGNGAVFKRMGFLAEQFGEDQLVTACRERLTKGTVKIDPALDCATLVTRWRVWIPNYWRQERLDDRPARNS